MTQPKLIRKYVNRRLYDTTQSRYVNLEDLRKLIIAGANIKVVEQATGHEITDNGAIADHRRHLRNTARTCCSPSFSPS